MSIYRAMSLLTIPSRIFGYAVSVAKRLPGIAQLRPKNKSDENTASIDLAAINNFSPTKIGDSKMTFDLADKLKGLIEQIKSQNPNIEDGTDEFREIIIENIRPEILAGVQNITYNTGPLRNELKDFIDQREQDYVRRMNDILARNKKEGIKNFTEYDEVFDNFFMESLTILHNLNNIIFHRIISTEDFTASDLDLAKAFRHTKNLTKDLIKKLLEDFQMLLGKLPIEEGKEEDTRQYIEHVKRNSCTYNEILLRGERVGILDNDFVLAYLNHYVEKTKKGEQLSSIDLANIKEFHEGTHGCLLLTSGLQASVNPALDIKIVENTIKDLNEQIIALSKIKTQSKADKERRTKIDYRIANIVKNLAEMARTEKRVNESIDLFSQDETAVKVGISRERILELSKEHAAIAQIEDYIGRTKEENIATRNKDGSISSQKFPEEALANVFTLRGGADSRTRQSYSIEFSRNYERLILETSLFAGYHALAEKMDQLSDKQRENFFKKRTKLFANFDQDHVPWLKDLYNKELKRYRTIISEDKSSRKTADLAVGMCELCQRLASTDIDIYQSNDFFKRYGLEAIAESALERVGAMTDINTMSLALKVYSEIFSNLEQDAVAAGLSKHETKWLSTHVGYLKQLSEIKDKSGKVLYAPPTGNPYEIPKFEEIQKAFTDTDLVSYNIDLVLKYFENAIKEKKQTERGNDSYSDLDSRNLLLSSALMYYYLKFMPEFSKDSDSLRSREKIINLIFEPKIGISRNLPKELGPKLLDHFLGTESDAQGKPIEAAKYGRGGFLRSYALELEDKIDTYAEGKDFKDVSLTELLNFYYRLEQVKTRSTINAEKRNPIIVGKSPSAIDDDKLLGLWQRQEKAHIKFHNGKDRELLPPLKHKLKELLPSHSSEVMKFISHIPDKAIKQETSEFIAKELFKQAANSARDVLQYKAGNIVEVTDDNLKLLNTLTSALGNLSRVGNLIYKGNLSNFTLAENSVLGEDNRAEFKSDIETVETLFKSKFLLVDVVNKTGEKVRRVKDIALNLLKAFNIRPEIGNHLEWKTQREVENYIHKEQVLKFRQEEENLVNTAISNTRASRAA